MDTKWRTFAVLLILLVGVTGLILAAGAGEGSSGSITVQQAPTPEGGVEVLVTVPDDINVLETTNDRTVVDLVCADDTGETLVACHLYPPSNH